MFEKNLIALVAAALLLSSCATTTKAPPLSEEEQAILDANKAADTSAVAVPAGAPPVRIPLLAIEIEVSDEGVKPISAKIIHAPRPANAAFGDLHVEAKGVEGWSHTFADPRVIKVHDSEEKRTEMLESARTIVFLPLHAALTHLTIKPTADSALPGPFGGTFDVRELAKQACAELVQLNLPVCREIAPR